MKRWRVGDEITVPNLHWENGRVVRKVRRYRVVAHCGTYPAKIGSTDRVTVFDVIDFQGRRRRLGVEA